MNLNQSQTEYFKKKLSELPKADMDELATWPQEKQGRFFNAIMETMPADSTDAPNFIMPERATATAESTNRLPDQYNPARSDPDKGMVDRTTGVDTGTRLYLGAASGDNEAINILKAQGYEPALSPSGNLVVRKNGKMHAIDAQGVDTGDFTELVPTAVSGLAALAPLALGPGAGLLSILGMEGVTGAIGGLTNTAFADLGGAYSDKTDNQKYATLGGNVLTGAAMNAGTAGLMGLIGKLGKGAANYNPMLKTTSKTLAGNPALARGRDIIVDRKGTEPLAIGVSSSPVVGGLHRAADRAAGTTRITESIESQTAVQRQLMDEVQKPLKGTVLAGDAGWLRQDPSGIVPGSGNDARNEVISILRGSNVPRKGEVAEVTDEALDRSVAIYKQEEKTLYTDLGKEIQGDVTQVPSELVDGLVRSIDNILNIDPNLSGLNFSGAVVGRLRGIRSELLAPPPEIPVASGLLDLTGKPIPPPPVPEGPLTRPVTYDEFRKMKTALGEAIVWKNLWLKNVDSAGADIYGQMADGLVQTATRKSPHLGEQLQQVNKWYRDVRKLFDTRLVQSLEAGQAPQVLKRYFGDVSNLATLKRALEGQPEVYNNLRNAYFIDEVLQIKPNDPVYAMAGHGLKDKLAKLDNEGMYDHLFDQGEQIQLENLLVLSEAAQRVATHRTTLFDLIEGAKGPQGKGALPNKFLDDMDREMITIREEMGLPEATIEDVFRAAVGPNEADKLLDLLAVSQLNRKTLRSLGRTDELERPATPLRRYATEAALGGLAGSVGGLAHGILAAILVPTVDILSSAGVSKFLTSERGKLFLAYGPKGLKAMGGMSPAATKKLTPEAWDRIIKLTAGVTAASSLPQNQNKRRVSPRLLEPTQ